MTYATHFLGGALAGAWLAEQAGLGPAARLAALAAGGLGGLLPDLDHPHSFVGRRAPLLSDLAYGLLGHRGAFHSLLACLLAYLAALWLLKHSPFPAPAGKALAGALALGYASHLLLDALNPGGVALFWPLPWRLAAPLAESGGTLEKILVMPLLLLGFLSALVSAPPFAEAWRDLARTLRMPADVWDLAREALRKLASAFR